MLLRRTPWLQLPSPCAAYLALLMSGASLAATGVHADTAPAAPATTPTAEALLAGAQTANRNFTVTTGFHLTQNTIQLDTQLDGAAAASTFIIDSGAPMTIAPTLVQELGIKPAASVALAGPEGGHLEVPVVSLPEVAIAGLAFRNVGAVVDWVEPPDTLACLSTSGLLGASLLQAAIWQIDFETQQVTVTDSLSNLRGLRDAIKLPFKRSDAAGSPRIMVGVSDADDMSLLIDLGFNGSIAIPMALLQHTGDRIPETAPTEVGQASSTVFGDKPSEVHIIRLRELRLGDLHLQDFPVVTGTAVSDFHVGIEFLRHFRVTLDWMNDDLYLERRDPQSALYADFATYGFLPRLNNGQLVVSALWHDSSAENAGLKLGDQLVEIDGQDTTAPGFDAVCNLLNRLGQFGSEDDPISVTRLRDGERETVRVARMPLVNDGLISGGP
jgi:hypothetical protein